MAQCARVFLEIKKAIGLCVQKDLRTSALILLYSGVDIAGWMHGKKHTVQENFTAWVKAYMRPEKTLGCTALDLYGARCGIVHTFTPGSTLQIKGKVRKVIYAWSPSRVVDLRKLTDFGAMSRQYVAVQGDALIAAYGAGLDEFLNELSHLPSEQLEAIALKLFTDIPTEQVEGMKALAKAAGLP